MCNTINTGIIGETIEVKYVFTYDNGQPINLTTAYATREVFIYKEDGTLETSRSVTISGASSNEIVENYTLISPVGKKQVKIKLTKSNGKYRFYNVGFLKVK